MFLAATSFHSLLGSSLRTFGVFPQFFLGLFFALFGLFSIFFLTPPLPISVFRPLGSI